MNASNIEASVGLASSTVKGPQGECRPEAGPVRVQHRRTRGWKMPPNTVYVGRPGQFGNPYYLSEGTQHLSWFRADLLKERAAQGGPSEEHRWATHFWKMARRLPELRGKNLACWCKDGVACHADILLELANGPVE